MNNVTVRTRASASTVNAPALADESSVSKAPDAVILENIASPFKMNSYTNSTSSVSFHLITNAAEIPTKKLVMNCTTSAIFDPMTASSRFTS